MIPNNLLTIIVFVICSSVYTQSFAQITATIVWDEIKKIAFENGFKVSAFVNETEKRLRLENFCLLKTPQNQNT